MKLSVITPSFNQGKYIERTIQSVLNQKGDFELEHLIIDGGSTDNTLEILKKYNGRIDWVSEKDHGQSHAINKGFNKAKGDIIGWLNSDDLYEDGAVQKVFSMFNNNSNCKWVVGKCRVIDENGKEIRKAVTQYKNKWLARYSYERLLVEDFISQPAVWFRKSFLNEVGLLDENLHYTMDYDLWLRMGAKAEPVILNDYIASFRFYSGSKTGGELKKSLSEVRELCRRYANGRKSILMGNWMYRMKIRLGYGLLSLFER
ncbi:MAG: glycosyltransferase family 2 protein [Nitrospira sp.]|nr:glycosyltransferase family 2 protein [Nitrospira sp.]